MDISLLEIKFHNLLIVSGILLIVPFQLNQALTEFPSTRTIQQEIGGDLNFTCSHNLKAGDKLTFLINGIVYPIIVADNLADPFAFSLNTDEQIEVAMNFEPILATEPLSRPSEIRVTVRDTTYGNAGSYICNLGEKDVDEVKAAVTHVVIVGPPRDIVVSSRSLSVNISRRPTVPDELVYHSTSIAYDVTTDINQGHMLDLEVEILAVPDAQYKWIASNVEHHGDLSLTKDKNMSRVVYVIATNQYGTLNASVNIIAHYKPDIEPLVVKHYPGQGEKLTVDCVVNAMPAAVVFFVKVNEETGAWQRLQGQQHIRELGGTGVEIDIVDLTRDVGKYLCIAENLYGNDSAEFYIDGAPTESKVIVNLIYGDSAYLIFETKSSVETALTIFVNNTLEDGNLHSEENGVTIANFGSHQIHHTLPLEGLKPSTEYGVTIFASNKFGVSEPVTATFITLEEGVTRPPTSVKTAQKSADSDDDGSTASFKSSTLTFLPLFFIVLNSF